MILTGAYILIDRYCDPVIADVWSDQNRMNKWSGYETAYLNGIMIDKDLKVFPLRSPYINVSMVKENEKTTKHEIVAFLKEYSQNLNNNMFKGYDIVSKYIHYGLTSSDVIDTVFSALIRDSIYHCKDLIYTLIAVVDRKIQDTQSVPCIGRTHGKHAEAIMLSTRFELFKEELSFCLELFENAEATLYAKCSGPVGTSDQVNKFGAESVCSYFGLKLAPAQTQVIPRFYYHNTMHACVTLASIYERFATTIRLSCIDEINEMQEGFSEGQAGSSAMPHKNNPVSCENICGLARLIKTNYQVSLDNNVLWWERDISHSSNERIIWPQVFHLVAYTTSRFTNLLRNLSLNSEAMQANLQNSTVLNSHKELLQESEKSNRFDAYKKVQQDYL